MSSLWESVRLLSHCELEILNLIILAYIPWNHH